MINDLSKDQKIKLKRLFDKKNYSKFETQIEKLGSIENLPTYLKMGYAGSKVLNPNFLSSLIVPGLPNIING